MISNELNYLADSIPKKSVLVVHVGLKGIYSNSKSYDYQALTLLDEIRKQLEPKEIYVPTFTYNFTKSKVFNVRSTPGEVGRFSEELRRNSELGIKRSLDPVFSVVETEADEIKDRSLITSAFGEKSIWHHLDKVSHHILNINLATYIVSTQLHHFEYINNVPYRYLKTFAGEIVDWDGDTRPINYDYFVQDLSRDITWNREKISNLARSCGALVETSTIRSFDWQALKKSLINKISSNINYLIT